MPPIPVPTLKKLHAAGDYQGMLELIKTTMNIEGRLLVAWVNSGGLDAPAWIEMPLDMPFYGTDKFRELTIEMSVRMSFLKQSTYDEAAIVFAHELSHIVLNSLKHPLRNCEKAVDLTAMLLGFRRLYKSAADRRGRQLGYLSEIETRAAYHILSQKDSFFGSPSHLRQLKTDLRSRFIALLNRVKTSLSPSQTVGTQIGSRLSEGVIVGGALLAGIMIWVVTTGILSPADHDLSQPQSAPHTQEPPNASPTDRHDRSEIGLDLLEVEHAKKVQLRLAELGFFRGVPDGFWLSRSRQALREFKLTNDLPADDAWDEATASRLFSQAAFGRTKLDPKNTGRLPARAEGFYPPPQGTSLNPLNHTEAVILQNRLTSLGFFKGRSDGMWGAISRRALSDFKTAHGLPGDGEWNAETERALNEAESASGFLGTWADDDADCQIAPIQIGQNEARSKSGICQFNSVQREDAGWRVAAVCTMDGRKETQTIKISVLSGRLSWSSDAGTSIYVRCSNR